MTQRGQRGVGVADDSDNVMGRPQGCCRGDDVARGPGAGQHHDRFGVIDIRDFRGDRGPGAPGAARIADPRI